MKTLELRKIRREDGFAYIAHTNCLGMSSHKSPSTAVLFEDNVPLPGPTHVLRDEIRKLGNGRYSFWFGDVYFSASDNSDPRQNGRSYSVRYTENELDRYGIIVLPVLKMIYHPMMPKPVKNFWRNVGYHYDSIKHLKFMFPFWNLFYWISFFYTSRLRRKDEIDLRNQDL